MFAMEVVATPGIGAAAVDTGWRLHVDPATVEGWSTAEFGSVFVHHVGHLLRAHSHRAKARWVQAGDNGRLWLRAADAEINDDLVDAGLSQPGQVVLPSDFGAAPGRLAEEYFDLLRNADHPAGGEGATSPGGGSPPSDGHGVGAVDAEGTKPSGERPPSADPPVHAGGGTELSRRSPPLDDCGSGADGLGRPWDLPSMGAVSEGSARLLRWQTAHELRRHTAERGLVPGGWRRWAEGLLHPAADWRGVLGAELRSGLTFRAGAVDYSYSRPSRRDVLARPVVLPALRAPQPEIAIVCDTSGSVTGASLGRVLGEVEGVLRASGVADRGVRVLSCDAAVHVVQRVTRARNVTLLGGGGTDMGAGIEAAARLRPRPGVIVVLTDGYTRWPRYGPRGIRVVVGLLDDAAPEPPAWARSVRIGAE